MVLCFIKVSVVPETEIAGGRPVAEVLAAFRACVNRPGTMFGTEQWLLPILGRLTPLLNEPVTHDEAAALLDVLYERRRMADLFGWLEKGRPVAWSGFFEYRAKLEEQERQKQVEDRRRRAEERKRRRAERPDPYLDFKLPNDFFPKISDVCPDCGSGDWKPIAYGLPTEDTKQDARLGESVSGGYVVREARRYCTSCFNRWPTKPDMSKPKGTPESIEEQIAYSRSEYSKLAALADLAPDVDEPSVERAWARIDGSICFLVSFGNGKARVIETSSYARSGGAPVYGVMGIRSGRTYEEWQRLSTLAAVAAIRFERTKSPERHNLHNDWDKVQAYRRNFDRHWDEQGYRRERAKADREKLSKILKMARATPEKLPRVDGIRSSGQEKHFLVCFAWGTVQVRRYEWPLEPLRYQCWVSPNQAEDSELARDLACAAALLAEFPRLARATE